jgi:hypothetical protein
MNRAVKAEIYIPKVLFPYSITVRTRLDALMFGLSLDFQILNLKPGMRLLLLFWGGGYEIFVAILLFSYDKITVY